MLFCVTPFAFVQAQTPSADENIQTAGYPVVLDQKELFKIRAGYRGYSAKLGADDMSRRIKLLADDYGISPDSIKAQEGPFGSEIVAGDRVVLAATDDDAKAFGKNRQQLAKENAEIIGAAITQYRIDYSKKQAGSRFGLSDSDNTDFHSCDQADSQDLRKDPRQTAGQSQ